MPDWALNSAGTFDQDLSEAGLVNFMTSQWIEVVDSFWYSTQVEKVEGSE